MRRSSRRIPRITMPINTTETASPIRRVSRSWSANSPAFSVDLGDRHPGVNRLPHFRRPHGMQREARLDQILAPVDQAHLRLGNFHAGLFGGRQHGFGVLQRGVEPVQPTGHLGRRRRRRSARVVASRAYRFGPGEHRRRGSMHSVIGVADHAASATAGGREDGVVHAAFVELLEQHVAGSAHRGDRPAAVAWPRDFRGT